MILTKLALMVVWVCSLLGCVIRLLGIVSYCPGYAIFGVLSFLSNIGCGTLWSEVHNFAKTPPSDD